MILCISSYFSLLIPKNDDNLRKQIPDEIQIIYQDKLKI